MKIKKSELTKIIASGIEKVLSVNKKDRKDLEELSEKELLSVLKNKTYVLTYKDLKYDLGKTLQILASVFLTNNGNLV